MPGLKRYGEWALITGASAGIGKAFARAIAAEGLHCVLVARREERLRTLAKELEHTYGVTCRVLPTDLSSEGAVPALQETLRDVPIGVLVNNAGVGCSGRFEELEAPRMARMVALNCVCPVLLTRAFLPAMIQRGRGALLFVASISSFLPVPYDAAYGATKAFDLHLGEGLWAELRGTGVDVVTVCPYLTRTEFYAAEGMGKEAAQQAMKRSENPENVVRLALRNLGRKPTAAPPKTVLASWAARVAPRRWTALVMRKEMAKLHFDQL